MRCPYCQNDEDRVVDSRTSREGRAIRRRRECTGCGRRFTTYEYVEERPLQIRKRSGEREGYDRRKLLRGIRMACAKRPVAADEIERVVEEVERWLDRQDEQEVGSDVLGERVMEQLKTRDHIAYVRFASVYRNFQDLTEFYEELRELDARGGNPALRRLQEELPLGKSEE
ncbi:MAG: transcriptional regulator NrdR [Longimicrobiaceae bacterium]